MCGFLACVKSFSPQHFVRPTLSPFGDKNPKTRECTRLDQWPVVPGARVACVTTGPSDSWVHTSATSLCWFMDSVNFSPWEFFENTFPKSWDSKTLRFQVSLCLGIQESLWHMVPCHASKCFSVWLWLIADGCVPMHLGCKLPSRGVMLKGVGTSSKITTEWPAEVCLGR